LEKGQGTRCPLGQRREAGNPGRFSVGERGEPSEMASYIKPFNMLRFSG